MKKKNRTNFFFGCLWSLRSFGSFRSYRSKPQKTHRGRFFFKCDWRVEDSKYTKDLQDPINSKISNTNGLIDQKYIKNSKENSFNKKMAFGEWPGSRLRTHEV